MRNMIGKKWSVMKWSDMHLTDQMTRVKIPSVRIWWFEWPNVLVNDDLKMNGHLAVLNPWENLLHLKSITIITLKKSSGKTDILFDPLDVSQANFLLGFHYVCSDGSIPTSTGSAVDSLRLSVWVVVFTYLFDSVDDHGRLITFNFGALAQLSEGR